MDETRYGTGVVVVGGIQILLFVTLRVGGWLYPPPNSELTSVDNGLWLVLAGGGLVLLRLGFLLRGDNLQLPDEAEEGIPRWSLVVEAYTLASLAILGSLTTLLGYFG